MKQLLFAVALVGQHFEWPTKTITVTPVGEEIADEFTQLGGAIVWHDGRVLVGDWKHALGQKAHLADGLPPARRPQFLALINELPRQEQFGRFDLARADAAGRLWLRTYEQYGSPTALWLVLADGKPVAKAVLPGRTWNRWLSLVT